MNEQECETADSTVERELRYYQSMLPELGRAAARYRILQNAVHEGKLLAATDSGFELIKDLDVYTSSLIHKAERTVDTNYLRAAQQVLSVKIPKELRDGIDARSSS